MNSKTRINKLIDDTGLVKSIRSLENKLSLSEGTIANWDVQFPGLKNVVKVADFFDCSIDYLYGRTDEPMTSAHAKAVEKYDLSDLVACYQGRYRLTTQQQLNLQSVINAYVNEHKGDC